MSVLFAVDVDAHLVKCAVNKEILIPDLRRNSFTHLAVVCEFTGLCGYAYDSKS